MNNFYFFSFLAGTLKFHCCRNRLLCLLWPVEVPNERPPLPLSFQYVRFSFLHLMFLFCFVYMNCSMILFFFLNFHFLTDGCKKITNLIWVIGKTCILSNVSGWYIICAWYYHILIALGNVYIFLSLRYEYDHLYLVIHISCFIPLNKKKKKRKMNCNLMD